jgi:hypothetical protein
VKLDKQNIQLLHEADLQNCPAAGVIMQQKIAI